MSLSAIGVAVTRTGFETLQNWICDQDRPIEIQDFVDPDLIAGDCSELVAYYKQALVAHHGHRGIHGPFFGLDMANPDRDIRAIVQKRFLKGLEIAEALSAKHMVIHSPFSYWDLLNRDNYPKSIPAMCDAAAQSLSEVLPRAADIGCDLVIENIEDTDPRMRVELIQQIAHPNLKASIDTGHADLAHGRYTAPPVVDFIAAASGYLGHVHLQDADGYADRHWHPGQGRLNWQPILKAIDELDEAPHLILEVRDQIALLPDTAAWLEGLSI